MINRSLIGQLTIRSSSATGARSAWGARSTGSCVNQGGACSSRLLTLAPKCAGIRTILLAHEDRKPYLSPPDASRNRGTAIPQEPSDFAAGLIRLSLLAFLELNGHLFDRASERVVPRIVVLGHRRVFSTESSCSNQAISRRVIAQECDVTASRELTLRLASSHPQLIYWTELGLKSSLDPALPHDRRRVLHFNSSPSPYAFGVQFQLDTDGDYGRMPSYR